jgi:hypothetical protein
MTNFWDGFSKQAGSSGATYNRDQALAIKPSQETIHQVGPWQVKDDKKSPGSTTPKEPKTSTMTGDANLEGEMDQAELQRGDPTPRDGYRGYPGGI